MLRHGFDGDQTAVAARLGELGYEVSQSTVSRALHLVGAKRTTDKDGTRYEGPDGASSVAEGVGVGGGFGVALSVLVLKVDANESLVIVRTSPGSAPLVASMIDAKFGTKILGTLAGDDTIFVAPRSTRRIKALRVALSAFIERS
jgi:transcriptional regulator of arginine metabolism